MANPAFLVVLMSMAQASPLEWDGDPIPTRAGPGVIPQVVLKTSTSDAPLSCDMLPAGCEEVVRLESKDESNVWMRVSLRPSVDPWSYSRDVSAKTPQRDSWVEPTLLPIAMDWQEEARASDWASPVVDRAATRLSVPCGVVGYASDHPALAPSSLTPLAPLGLGVESDLIALMIEHAGADSSAEVSISHHPVHTREGGAQPAGALVNACDTVGPGGVVLVLTQTWSEGGFAVATAHPMFAASVEYCVGRGVLVVAGSGNDEGPVAGDEEVPSDPVELNLRGALVIGALGHDPSHFESTRRVTPLWSDPTVNVGDQRWAGTAAAAARVAGAAWRIQSEFMDEQGEPLTPADLQRFLLASSYDEGTPDRVPNLQGALDRLRGPRDTTSRSAYRRVGLVVGLACLALGVLMCTGFFVWIFRGLFSR
jgi:hypothetical protein